MLHNVKSTKLQVTLIDGDHPEGLNRVFNNLVAQPSDEQIASFQTILEGLAGGTVQEATLTTATTLTNK
ncbi:hypothetical protein [Limosilactobacillus fermentum]|uniref:DUF1659 domain-containing protein n=1 Tax=Limosilactobacillus fermentum TaxID=1613 RepID=UPI001C00676D|nr:hypothetical protein [Limosilactobacillus fermentum]WFA01563.1 hypothetical protein P3T70_08355 [Limosilactobacillus fermentum]WNY94522.1 hypothetical protein PE049_07465 [Limosilactobacillus fermentum]